MRFFFTNLAGALLLSTALSTSALAQQRVDQLGSAGAIQGTHSVPVCQSCGAAVSLVSATFSQILTYIQANIVVPLTTGVSGTLPEANGGTGETTYSAGQLLIGNSAGGLTKATLTEGANITIAEGDGSITIAATGGGSPGGTAGQIQFNDDDAFGGYPVSGSSGTVLMTDGDLGSATNLPVGGLAAMAANTIVGNATGSAAPPTELAIPDCDAEDEAIQYTAGTGFSCDTVGAGAGSLSVEDGTVTVDPTTTLQFDSTTFSVTNAGSGVAQVKIINTVRTDSGATVSIAASDAQKTVRATNAAPTYALDDAATLGATFGFYAECDASGGCIIDPDSAETIDGAATLKLPTGYKGYISTDGTGWRAGLLMPTPPPFAAPIGWVPETNPDEAVIFTASAPYQVTDIRGTVVAAVGATATITVYKAPSGTACASGTAQHSGTFNADGTANTNQTLTLVGGADNILADGDRLCIKTAHGAAFASGNGNGGITVMLRQN